MGGVVGTVDRGMDEDGHELHGGIRLIRDTFLKAGEGKLTCMEATMTYGEGNAQFLTFSGVRKQDGQPFTITCQVPAGAPLGGHVRRAARSLIDPEITEE